MIDAPHITTIPARNTAMIHLTIPRAEIQSVMGPGLSEVKAVIAAQGIDITGPWFTHHLRMDPKVFDFEICMPVKSPIRPAGRVVPGTVPAARVARTIYHGPYEGLGEAWGQFGEWVKAQGHTPAPDLWEIYTVGPESGASAAQWQTELIRPVL